MKSGFYRNFLQVARNGPVGRSVSRGAGTPGARQKGSEIFEGNTGGIDFFRLKVGWNGNWGFQKDVLLTNLYWLLTSTWLKLAFI